MLYLGHFSFNENNGKDRYGYFSCMVEAKTPEAAENAFKKLILDVRKKKRLFTDPVDIYLDTFIEIGGIPKAGVITCYSSYSREHDGRISTYLPHEDVGGCKPYYYYPDDRPDIADKIDAMKAHDDVPFVTFEPTAAQERAILLNEQLENAARLAQLKKKNPFSKKPHW